MKNIIDFLRENIIFIFSILIIFIIIYLLYSTNKTEKFDTTSAVSNDMNQAIIKAVDDKYKADISAMRNLASIAKIILTTKNDELNIPAKNVNMNTLHLNDNPVDTTIFVRYMIMPWAGDVNNIPRGWVLCDGSVYEIDNINDYLNDTLYDSIDNINKVILNKYNIDNNDYINATDKYIVTPNLIGKFILGSGTITIDKTNQSMYKAVFDSNGGLITTPGNTSITFNQNDVGGETAHILTKAEVPAHRHKVFTNIISGYEGNMSVIDEGDNSKITFDGYEYTDQSSTYAARVARGPTKETEKQIVAEASFTLENTQLVTTPIDSDPSKLSEADKPWNKVSRAITHTDNGECGGSLKTKATNGLSNSIYNDVPFNVMPPYYVLTYIMKL